MERTIPTIITSKSVAQGFLSTGNTFQARSPTQTAVPAGSYLQSHVDIAPTILSHFGIATPSNYDGKNIGGDAVVGNSVASLTGVGSGLVSHMSFDGNVNQTLAGNGGTIRGTGVSFTAGKFGQAITVANYGEGSVLLDDDLANQFGSSDFSISMWVKYDSVTGAPTFFSNKDFSDTSNTGISLSGSDATAGSGDNGLFLNTKGSTDSATGDFDAPESFAIGEWQNVVLNVDRDGRTAVYIDGILIGARDDTTLGSLDGTFNWALLNDGTGSFGLGNANVGFSGLAIDEFAAWDRLLTYDEISTLATNKLTATAVPEPGSLGVLGVASLLVVLRRRRSCG